MLPVFHFLNNNPPSSLTENFGLKIKDYDNFMILNYDQIETDKNDSRWHDCRGLIIRKKPMGEYTDNDIMCRPFSRFFNYRETERSNTFDFQNSICFAKIDGSLTSVYFNEFTNRWEVATRQMAFCEGNTISGVNFRNLFLSGGFDNSEDKFQIAMETINKAIPGYTWIFETTSPENRVVTPYSGRNIWFLAARHNITGSYLMAGPDIRVFLELCIPTIRFPNEYVFSSGSDCEKAAEELPNLEEGYVVFNPITEERIKIKSPQYVAIHHLRDNGVLNPKRIMELVRINEHEEYLIYFECDREAFMPYIKGYANLKENILKTFNDIKHLEVQKDFAIEACKTSYASVLFEMRKGLHLDVALDKMNIDKLLSMVA